MLGTSRDLDSLVRRLDGKGYKAYNDIKGSWDMGDFTLIVDHIQGDPFAAPSRFRVRVSSQKACFPLDTFQSFTRNIALCDFLTRIFFTRCFSGGLDQAQGGGGWSGAKGGDIGIDKPSQHVLQRTSVVVSAHYVEARFTVSLPAQGRSIMAQAACRILLDSIPTLVRDSLIFGQFSPERVQHLYTHIRSVEDQRAARSMLAAKGLIAFVANGAILPRASGASDQPMAAGTAVPFQSPPSLEVVLVLPNCGEVRGMGLRRGITLIGTTCMCRLLLR
jgi:predicted ABC-class ATPase